ncbi:hypothetical protein CRENBAI_003866 [Crenichthys baileyi]|uniref:Uncharacterized protein n=1 Tax=Crenichthys baileyi TaxID=28760 RepID=A0AAV9SR10_9TELE
MGGAAASLGDNAVAEEDAGLLAVALTSAERETTAPDVTATAMGYSSPAETQEGALRRLKHRKVLHADASCGGRRTSALLPDLGVQPGKQADSSGEGRRTEDISFAPPSAAERSDPWHSPAYRL